MIAPKLFRSTWSLTQQHSVKLDAPSPVAEREYLSIDASKRTAATATSTDPDQSRPTAIDTSSVSVLTSVRGVDRATQAIRPGVPVVPVATEHKARWLATVHVPVEVNVLV